MKGQKQKKKIKQTKHKFVYQLSSLYRRNIKTIININLIFCNLFARIDIYNVENVHSFFEKYNFSNINKSACV